MIDRIAVMRRHAVRYDRPHPEAPLSVGNGRFAFTCDATGLQTFDADHRLPPLCTMAEWGWHTTPRPAGLVDATLRLRDYPFAGRTIGYPTSPDGQQALFAWLRENPHRFHLARIGFAFDDTVRSLSDLADVRQELDPAEGIIRSAFSVAGAPVAVETFVLPDADAVVAIVRSPLIANDRLAFDFTLPAASFVMSGADWEHPERHATALEISSDRRFALRRTLDAMAYRVEIALGGPSEVEWVGTHHIRIHPATDGDVASIVVRFVPRRVPGIDVPPAVRWDPPDPVAARERTAAHWRAYWEAGAALDLGGSTAPGAEELERRMALSGYLTAIQCAGAFPPQETGLTNNSWYGKFHLEMHWWHAVHFALWNRPDVFARSLDYYARILPSARERARSQGFAGARWPKMTDPSGAESPSAINPLIIWQQPHPIVFAELLYRARPGRETLDRFAEIVFASAEFMADFAVWSEARGRYEILPPIVAAHEASPPEITRNPSFELAYWRHGLMIAQAWRELLGLPRDMAWDRVAAYLAPLPETDGVYLIHEGLPDTFGRYAVDHPSMLGALGMLPPGYADRATMERTLRRVMAGWRWDDAWGWDFPMAAMTAARLDLPDVAVAALLIESEKNRYLANGHNWQKESLSTYLPGNGGLLAALAIMAAPAEPIFPRDGTWSVRAEGFAAPP